MAPRLILTAAHVVRAQSQALTVKYLGVDHAATVIFISPESVANDTPAERHPDVALLAIEEDPCPWYPRFDIGTPSTNVLLSMYGFGVDANTGGDPVTGNFEGTSFHDDRREIPVFRLKQGRMTPGLSGSAVFIEGDPSHVIGVAVETADPHFDFGGYATPASEIVPLLKPHVPSLDVVMTGAQSPSDMEAPPARRRSDSLVQGGSRRNLKIQQLIDRAERERRQYRPAAARATSQEAAELARDGAPPALLGRALRTQAVMLAADRFTHVRASELADEALMVDGDTIANERVRALIAESADGPEAALAQITPGANSELEIMRVGYLIDSDVREARRVLSTLPQSEADRPRARRVRVLAAMVERRQGEMVSVAETLVAAGREDYTIAYAAIAAFVLGSIPTPLWPRSIGAWPEPFPVEEAVDTEEQRQRLATAADLAAEILDRSELDGQYREVMETWRLAALALSAETRAEATAYAKTLLAGDTPNHRAIIWADTMGLLPQDDIDAAVTRLSLIAGRDNASAESVLILVVILLQSDRAPDAEASLRRNEQLFRTTQEISRYRVLLAEALAAQKDFTNARRLQEQISDPEDWRAVEASIRRREGPSETAHRRLYDYWNECGDVRVLLIAADIAKNLGDWEFLADVGGPLLEHFRNVSTARLAMYGAFNAQRYGTAIERYAEFRALDIGVPQDLLRLRTLALERMSSNEALPAFKELLKAAPSDANYYAAGYAHVRRGDLRGAVALAQEYACSDEIKPETALAYASWIRSADPDLARRILRLAMPAVAAKENLVFPAFRLAHQLGISNETQALQEPLQRIGREDAGGIRRVTLEEAVEAVRAAAQHSADVFERYRRGEIPIHSLTSATNTDLYNSHLLQARSNAERSAAQWTHVFVRHGGRSAHDDRLDRPHLLLDATSFLLAIELGVLDVLVKRRKVFVSQSLGALLLWMLDDRVPENPPDREARRRLISDVESGRVDVVDVSDEKLDAYVLEHDLTLIDWGTKENEELHAASGARWCTPMRLVEELQRRGSLGAAGRDVALIAFGNVRETGGNGPATNEGLVMRWNTAEMLYQADLPKSLRGRRLTVQQRYLDFVRAKLAEEDRREEAAGWLRSAMDRLSALIVSGEIITVPDPAGDEGNLKSLELRVAFAAFSSTLPDDTVIVMDDRFFTGYLARDDGTPVASLWDVVQAVQTCDDERTSDEVMLQLSLAMRRRGFMYIPLLDAEIMSVLRRTPVLEGELTSSEEMRVLERYIASALLDTEALYARDHSVTGPRMSQILFLFELSQAVRSAIEQLFATGDADDELRASWVRDHLSPEALPGYGIAGFAPRDPQGAVDLEVAGYLTQFFR